VYIIGYLLSDLFPRHLQHVRLGGLTICNLLFADLDERGWTQ